MTGPTNAISIVMDFNTLEELERLNDLATQDSTFAGIWADVERHLLPGRNEPPSTASPITPRASSRPRRRPPPAVSCAS